jgi:hypothetical protein
MFFSLLLNLQVIEFIYTRSLFLFHPSLWTVSYTKCYLNRLNEIICLRNIGKEL